MADTLLNCGGEAETVTETTGDWEEPQEDIVTCRSDVITRHCTCWHLPNTSLTLFSFPRDQPAGSVTLFSNIGALNCSRVVLLCSTIQTW